MRNDAHSPANIRPADYTHLFTFCGAGRSDNVIPVAVDLARRTAEQAGDTYRGAKGDRGHIWQCTVCGAFYNTGSFFRHEPTGELITMGQDCQQKYEMLADHAEFYRQSAEIVAERAKETAARLTAGRRAAMIDAHPDLPALLALSNPIAQDMARRFERTGDLSDRQITFLRTLASRKTVDAPSGRLTARGTVVSVKEKASLSYGSRLVMTVRMDGWTAWGTVPNAVINDLKVGDEVELTATFSPSDRDRSFAPFKRPLVAIVRQELSPQNVDE